MELKRILAKDARSAMDIATERYGKDVLVVSSQAVGGQVELVVALDVQPEPPPEPEAQPSAPSAFTQAFRQALGPMPEPELEPQPESQPESAVETQPAVQAEAPAANVSTAAEMTMAFVPTAVPVSWMLDAAPVARPEVTAPAPAMLPAVEAVAAVSVVAAVPTASLPPDPAPASEARAHEAIDLVRREIAALRQEFQLSRQIQAFQQPQAWPADIAPLIAALHDNGVPAGLRALLMDSITQARDADDAAQTMRQLMSDALAGLPVADLSQGVHALCGPSGAGKSSMIARLASAASQRLGAEQVALVVFNDTRSGAWSQMQILAAQAGVTCYRAPDDKTLRLLLDELGARRLVFIDTAGSDCMAQAQRLRALDLGIQAHALMPADGSIGSVRRVLSQEADWASVMISKIDECESPWPLLQALCDRRWGVSCTAATADLQQPAQPFDVQVLLQPAFERLGTETQAVTSVTSVTPAAKAARVRAKAPRKTVDKSVAEAAPEAAPQAAPRPRTRVRARAVAAQATA